MKVLHYSSSLSRSAGGLYYSVSGLARAMRDSGIDVTVMGGRDAFFDADAAVWGDVPLISHELKFGAYTPSAKVFGALARLTPDIVHIHGIWSPGSAYGRLAVISNIPVVVSPRGMLDRWILARKPAVKAVHAALFERPMLRWAHVHALAEAEREAVTDFMPGAADRTFVIPNGVPPISATKAPSTDRHGFLYLSRVHEKKQTLELIEAWGKTPALASQTLTIAGWGHPDYEAQVAAAAAATPGVTFVGSLYGAEKEAAFRQARFFILPSLSEGLPMAVLEALQFGCVPIITDQCNLPELFADRIALRIENDFSDFAQVLGNAVSSPDSGESAAAQAYSQRYLWSSIAARMVVQYQAILAAPQGASA